MYKRQGHDRERDRRVGGGTKDRRDTDAGAELDRQAEDACEHAPQRRADEEERRHLAAEKARRERDGREDELRACLLYTSTPIALSIMAVELLGASVLPHVMIVTVIAYLLAGHRGIYPAQRLFRRKHGGLLPRLIALRDYRGAQKTPPSPEPPSKDPPSKDPPSKEPPSSE